MDVPFIFQNINFYEISVSFLTTSIFEDRQSRALSSEESYRRFYGTCCRHLQRISQQYETPYPRTLLTYLLTYLLTPWSRVLLEKLTGSAASQEIPRIFGTQRFITVLISARHLSLS